MIVANHMGEDVIPFVVVAGAALPALLIPVRARLSRMGRAVRRPAAVLGLRSRMDGRGKTVSRPLVDLDSGR